MEGTFGSMVTPLGRASLVVNERGALTHLWFETWEGPTDTHGLPEDPARTEAWRGQIDAYFAKRLREFTLEIDPPGTPFQRAVWQSLMRVPYGGTRTYGQIAEEIGQPKAVRAVGAAVGANRLALVVPCHRIVATGGGLHGYAGGLGMKARLLKFEGAIPEGLFDAV